MKRFDAAALHAAVDAERARRNMTWRQLACEIGVSESTIRRTREGGRMEVDGMLNIVGWLGVPVEDFVRETEILDLATSGGLRERGPPDVVSSHLAIRDAVDRDPSVSETAAMGDFAEP